MPPLHRFFLLLAAVSLLTSCAGAVNGLRNNVESVDFKASYGGANVRIGGHLRPLDGFKK